MKWFKLTNIFFKWVAQRYQHLLIHHISKEVTCHTVGGLIGRPKLMIFLGIILFLMHVSSLHIFLLITQLFFFWVSSCSFIFSYDDFLFFSRKPEPLETSQRFDASSSMIRQAIRIKLLELHRYAIHQVLVDWMSWKCVATMFFLTFCISLKTFSWSLKNHPMAEILCRHLADQGDWWPVHAPGADSDVVSFHHPIYRRPDILRFSEWRVAE